jgi:hypothetical protein
MIIKSEKYYLAKEISNEFYSEMITIRSGRRPHRSTVNMTTIDCGIRITARMVVPMSLGKPNYTKQYN